MRRAAAIKKIALYARVSTKDGRQDTENQLIVLREHAAKQDWEIVEEYVDHERGGTAKRPQFQRMFADAARRKFDLVLFWALDRFSREGTLATLQHLEKLSAAGVDWRSHQEAYLDSCGPFSDVVVSLMATLAKQESIRRSERAVAGVARARRNGHSLGRRRKLIGSAHARALQLRNEGMAIRQIATELRKDVGKVSVMTVQRMLSKHVKEVAKHGGK